MSIMSDYYQRKQSQPDSKEWQCRHCGRVNWRELEFDNGDRPSDTDGIWTRKEKGVIVDGKFIVSPPNVMLIEHKRWDYMAPRGGGWWLSQGQLTTYNDFIFADDRCVLYIEFTNGIPWTYPAQYAIFDKSMKLPGWRPLLRMANSREELREALQARRHKRFL